MNTNEWKVVGRFVALIVSLYSAVSEYFKDAKVPLEILEWLSKEGKVYLQEAVKDLISKYKQSLPEIFLTVLRKVKVSAVPSKKTADCFTNKKRYYYRDGALDCWLPEDQFTEDKGEFSVLKLERESTFKKFLDFQIGRETADVAELSRELRSRGYTTTLSRIENLIEQQENGTDVGLRTDGYVNFFLVLDKEGDVSVVRVGCVDGQWYVYVGRLVNGRGWNVGGRLFLRN